MLPIIHLQSRCEHTIWIPGISVTSKSAAYYSYGKLWQCDKITFQLFKLAEYLVVAALCYSCCISRCWWRPCEMQNCIKLDHMHGECSLSSECLFQIGFCNESTECSYWSPFFPVWMHYVTFNAYSVNFVIYQVVDRVFTLWHFRVEDFASAADTVLLSSIPLRFVASLYSFRVPVHM